MPIGTLLTGAFAVRSHHALLAATLSWSAMGGALTTRDVLALDGILVRSTVVISNEENSVNVSTHRIDHVYRGPAKLKGHWFEYRHHLVGPGTLHGLRVRGAPPQMGEVGIWMLTQNDERIYPETRGRLGIDFPQRKDDDEDYLEVVDLVELIEKYDALAQDERLDVLKEAARGTNPTIAYWGVCEIGRSKLKFSTAMLDALIYDKTLLIAGQVALDEELTKLQGDFWRHSAHRLRMVKTWLTAPLPPSDEKRVRQRLSVIVARPDTDGFAPEERAAMSAAVRKRFSKGDDR